MNVQINKVTKQNGYTYMSFSCEKMSADVLVGPHGVRVVNKNASHKTWGAWASNSSTLQMQKQITNRAR